MRHIVIEWPSLMAITVHVRHGVNDRVIRNCEEITSWFATWHLLAIVRFAGVVRILIMDDRLCMRGGKGIWEGGAWRARRVR